MSLETCYAQLGGDLEDVRSRLVTDERIIKFIGIFEQSPLFDNLQKALDEGNMEEAFRAAHTMKGNSRDMGFMPLYEASCELSEVLRLDDAGVPAGPLEQVPELFGRLETAYRTTMDAFAQI